MKSTKLLFNAFDFDDMIILPLQLFSTNELILKKYQKKYEYTMVDEFQDTSVLQYKILVDRKQSLQYISEMKKIWN